MNIMHKWCRISGSVQFKSDRCGLFCTAALSISSTSPCRRTQRLNDESKLPSMHQSAPPSRSSAPPSRRAPACLWATAGSPGGCLRSSSAARWGWAAPTWPWSSARWSWTGWREILNRSLGKNDRVMLDELFLLPRGLNCGWLVLQSGAGHCGAQTRVSGHPDSDQQAAKWTAADGGGKAQKKLSSSL